MLQRISLAGRAMPFRRADVQLPCRGAETTTLPTLFPILILKTGALGDVVRTTALVPGLRSAHPDARITWVTAPAVFCAEVL